MADRKFGPVQEPLWNVPNCGCDEKRYTYVILARDMEFQLRMFKCYGCNRILHQRWVQVKPLNLGMYEIQGLIFEQRAIIQALVDMLPPNHGDHVYYQAQLCALATLTLAIRQKSEGSMWTPGEGCVIPKEATSEE